MFMYTQIVSSWVLSGNRVHVKAKLWAGDHMIAISNYYHHETLGFFFFTLLVLSVCRKKKMKAREPSLRLSVFNELREEAERERFCWRFFSLLVSPILLFLIFFFYLRRKIRQKNTHTQEEKINKCFSFTPCFELCRREMAVRKRREATIREVTDFVSADRLRHTESCMRRQCLRCLHYLKEFLSFCDISYYSSRWIYDVVYIGKVV